KIHLVEGIRGILDGKVPETRDGVIEMIDLAQAQKNSFERSNKFKSVDQIWKEVITGIQREYLDKDVLFITNTHDIERKVNNLIVNTFYSPKNPQQLLPKGDLNSLKPLVAPKVKLMVNQKVKDRYGVVFNNGYSSTVRAIAVPEWFIPGNTEHNKNARAEMGKNKK